jgi:hypothetical protein
MGSINFKASLLESLERKKMARIRPFSSMRFRQDLLSRALEMKIESFQDVKDLYEEETGRHHRTAKLFVRGLLTYMGDHSNYPYTFYPEGITRIENMYPDDDTWEVQITKSEERGEMVTNGEIKLIRKGADAGDAVEEHIGDMICHISRSVLYNNCEEAIKDMEAHLIESDDNDGYESDEREVKVYECETCPICFEKLETNLVLFGKESFIPKCGHPVCVDCKENIDKCPTCRATYKVMGNCYDDAKELVENEIDECIARLDEDRLKTLINVKAVAEQCLEEDGLCHSIGFDYEVDWGYEDGLEAERDYHWLWRWGGGSYLRDY